MKIHLLINAPCCPKEPTPALTMQEAGADCQQSQVFSASVAIKGILKPFLRLAFRWKGHSWASILRTEWIVLRSSVAGFLLSTVMRGRLSASASKPIRITPIALPLCPGDVVRVRSRHEIDGMLDSKHKLHGLSFMPGMRAFCGKEYRVLKRVRQIQIESTGEVRQLKNTVLLEGVTCCGSIVECDRSCYYFWREEWLEKADHKLPGLTKFVLMSWMLLDLVNDIPMNIVC